MVHLVDPVRDGRKGNEQPVAVVSVTHVFKERFVDRQRIRRQCSYLTHLTL